MVVIVVVVHEGAEEWVSHTTSSCCWLYMLIPNSIDTLNSIHIVRGGSLCAISRLCLSITTIIFPKVIITCQLCDA